VARLSAVQVMAFGKTGPMTFSGLWQDQAPARDRRRVNLRGRQIAMRVSALTPDDSITEVVVSGIGHRPETRLADTVDYPERWPLGVSTHMVCLDLVNLEGSTWQD
jgi:hypothetical protein